MATVANLSSQVLFRIEEVPGASVFWNTQSEIYSALIEAISDLLLLVGRPTQIVNQIVTIQPNTPWQPMPTGMLAITDIMGPNSQVWKYGLFDMDFTQSSWGSDWENDVDSGFQQWFPVGFTMFGIHPSVSSAVQVTVTGVAVPTTNSWPYSGNETVPFSDEFFQALEKYAAHYCRFKEQGNEFQLSLALYQEYLADAERMTAIQDRRDSYIFSKNLGVQVGVPQTTAR